MSDQDRTIPERPPAHWECDCVPDLGPSHCHACSVRLGREVPWLEVHDDDDDEQQLKKRTW